MCKRIKFIVSFLLIFAIFVGYFCIPAASYENDVETSTADMFLVNMDTDTVVFSQKPDNMWYAGTLSELMTYLLAVENLSETDQIEYKVERSFISALPHSDGCLNPYVGKTLTATDLEAIMLLTSGSDAAYALADLVTDNDRAAFVEMMNSRASELGCTKTNFASPGYDETTNHVTSCRDLYLIYKQVRMNKFYRKVMEENAYTPIGYGDEYTVHSEASIMNENSPYYFRYVNDAMYSHSAVTYTGIALTTTYKGNTYFYAGLLGLDDSEKNVYADAKRLTSWAYLNLVDVKVIDSEDAVFTERVDTSWGSYDISLHPDNSSVKTLPKDYDEKKLSYEFDVPDKLKTPLFMDQAVGKATLTYDGEVIGDVKLVVDSDEGFGMLSDMGRFTAYIYSQLTVNEPAPEDDTASAGSSSDETANAVVEPSAAETEG